MTLECRFKKKKLVRILIINGRDGNESESKVKNGKDNEKVMKI